MFYTILKMINYHANKIQTGFFPPIKPTLESEPWSLFNLCISDGNTFELDKIVYYPTNSKYKFIKARLAEKINGFELDWIDVKTRKTPEELFKLKMPQAISLNIFDCFGTTRKIVKMYKPAIIKEDEDDDIITIKFSSMKEIDKK